MDLKNLESIARALVAPGKGILAADESGGTIKKRFDKIGVESTKESRRSYRELLFTTPGINQHLSGVILFDETLRQKAKNGRAFSQVLAAQGIIPGIKVDLGTVPFNNSETEKITQGLDGLAERLQEYYALGARFAKWRAMYTIGDGLPSVALVAQNANDLAKYAQLCQEANIVPIVEPEVLMDGAHSIEQCYDVTSAVLMAVFSALQKYDVAFMGLLLKPNMVIAGEKSAMQATPEQVAELTLKCFSKVVPAEVPGIVFLSGGQSEELACETLNAINLAKGGSPWELSFSYGRALQQSALKTWGGRQENVAVGQMAFMRQVQMVSAARNGHYPSIK